MHSLRTFLRRIPAGLICLGIVVCLFTGIGLRMGATNMLNALMDADNIKVFGALKELK